MAVSDVLPLLACPRCGSPLARTISTGTETLRCEACGCGAPVIDGIPRFVNDETASGEPDAVRRTRASFGYEWTRFRDWKPSGETNFKDYFTGIDLASLRTCVVLDAGCGMGRHARQIAPHAQCVIAIDFSRAIDQAARNVASASNVHCVQADLLALPLADASFDFVYSLGVLHHLANTEQALAGLVRKLRPGGHVRIYLYWKRHGWQGAMLKVATAARWLTTRIPLPLLQLPCWVLSIVLYIAVVVPYRALSAAGVRRHQVWPLFVYSKYPFNVLYNDQFDRFSAPIEKRYDLDEVRSLLQAAGLTDVRVIPCFGWIADGVKPA
jgi:SAM-dependent methyltransferase